MTKGPYHRKETGEALARSASPLAIRTCLPGVFRLALCLLALVALSACARRAPQEPPELFDFTKDLGLGKDILAVQQVDTDTDKVTEWVVFYRFDKAGEGGPVAALIYDVVREPASQLPMVYPYKLRTPDQSYLAQDVPGLYRYDILKESSGTARNELVFATDRELAVFRLTRDPEVFATDNPPLYRCIGFFRNDEVAFDPKTFVVTVTSRAGLERSQLVARSYYRPESSALMDGYFVTNTTTLPTPYESEVDFPEGAISAAVLDTPYPEKIVLAFYQTLGETKPPTDILYYLARQAATDFKEGRLKYGSPYPTEQVARAVVTELSYFATQDTDTVAHVRVNVIYHSKTGQQSSPIETHWRLVRTENRWKMDYPGQ
jgi:hypothetical protein